MRLPLLFFALGLCALAAVPAPVCAQDGTIDYAIEVDPKSVATFLRDQDGKRIRQVSLNFLIKRSTDGVIVTGVPKDEIVVEEDGVPVANLDLIPPKGQQLTVILAIDVSGSMARGNKMKQAKDAAVAFLKKLDERADVGLILFDHELQVVEPPARDPQKVLAHRGRVQKLIESAEPKGGTAYIDASIKAVELLKGVTGRKAVVVMTDGVDMNSKAKLSEAIERAQIAELPVYTVGIGKPGTNEAVTTVLVLDRSGSMLEKADDNDNATKIDALKAAAVRYVDLMRPGAKTIIQTFSSRVDPLEGDFTDDKAQLARRIRSLKADGQTLLFDATFSGVMTLEAKNPGGKRAVVVLTDGKDEGSRRSDQEVVARAKELKIPLYMLGLGRPNEINEPVMRSMAKETGGDYYHAGSQKKLLEVFENLSIELHDDGIDEASLKKLAGETGGKYLHVENTSELSFFYEKLADEFQQTYKVTYAWPESARQFRDDGTARGIEVKIVRGGRVISKASKGADYVVRRLAVPQMNYAVYLVFLGVLALLLAFPAVLRRLGGKNAGA
jgi:VWFA-related protein